MKQVRQLGVTLVELLVVMVLMGIISAILVQYFVTQTRASELQKAINETSEAARVALSLITWDLQNAGYRVSYSSAKPYLIADGTGYKDIVTIRYRDDATNPPEVKNYYYAIGSSPLSLQRDAYNDASTLSAGPTVLGIVALNLRYETRANQFVMPSGTGTAKTCPSGSIADPPGKTGEDIQNCIVEWTFRDTPQQHVRQIKVQVLARSSARIPGHTNAVSSFSFDGTTTPYKAESGYVYQFAEQTIVAANLGR